MQSKKILTGTLLAFVGVSLTVMVVKEIRGQMQAAELAADDTGESGSAGEQGADVDPGAKHLVVVNYCHGMARCPDCEKIEAYTRETVEEHFAEELADGRIAWRTLNFEKPEHARFAKDCDISFSCVVLVDPRSQDALAPRVLEKKVWDWRNDKALFQESMQAEIRRFLEKRVASADG